MSKLKYGIATASAVAVLVGVAGVSSLSQAVADDVLGTQVSDLGTQRAKIEFEIQKQECYTLKNSQPQAFEACMQKAQSTRDNLLTQAQGSEVAGQGSQGGFASNQSQGQFSDQKKGTFDKMTSAVKETVAEVKEKLFGSDQPKAQQGQQGQGFAQGQTSQGGGSQGPNPLQRGFEARHMQGQGIAPQNLGADGGQGGQNFGQQGLTQGQQGQQGQFGQQGSFQGGNYGQQPQAQSGQQGTGGTNEQFQSGGPQGFQGSSNEQKGSMGGWAGEKQGAHMDRGEYYQALAREQYLTLKQECNTLKSDPSVYEQCQEHAESVRDKIEAMAEQGPEKGTERGT